ncbi:MAG: hypothetical protein M3Y44_15540 [Actinomycetota bacterium]|nr:hypothetical protein [Actinomycetota bacterium]
MPVADASIDSDVGSRDPQLDDAADADEQASDSQVTVFEAMAFAVATAMGLLSLVSLAAAHLHHNTPALVFPVALVLIAAVAVLVWTFDRPSFRVDRGGLLAGGFAVVVAAFMFFPGFQYGTSDRDPGAYVEIAAEIQTSHSVQFGAPLNSPTLPPAARPAEVARGWPALWFKDGSPDQIFPQFYHLWPALLASAKDAGGWTGLFNLGPLVGLIAVGLAVAVARRIAGLPGAWVTGVVLATNMLQVWQAKYPSAEIFGQMLFMAGLLGVVLAIRTGWRSGAALGGVLISLGYLERADGIVVVLIAWAILAALFAARRFDARAAWFAGGMLVLLPYGFFQAYHLAGRYTRVAEIPSLTKILEIMAAVAILALFIAWQGTLLKAVMSWSARTRVRITLGVAFVTLCAVLMVVGLLRPVLFGKDFQKGPTGPTRTFDEISLVRLTWFLSLAGFALLGAGIVWIAMRRWRTENWIVLFTAIPLLVLFCWHVRNSPYLMWSYRRFVTTVLPGMAILIGCGAAWCAWLLRTYVHRTAAIAATVAVAVGLGTFYLSQSLPLRRHNENGGSVELVERMAALADGHKGVFVWDPTGACCARISLLFGGSLMTLAKQDSTLGPADPARLSAMLTSLTAQHASDGRPLFYIGNGRPHPVQLPGLSVQSVQEMAGTLPHWAETFVSRPKGRVDYHYDFTVYRVTATG